MTHESLTLLEWEMSLETGMTQIDEQHRTLVEKIQALADRTKADRVSETLIFLQGYVIEHFGTEEKLHEESDFPEAEEHMEAHNTFIERFFVIKKEYDAANDEQFLFKLVNLLSGWLKEHIIGMDHRFADYHFQCHNVTRCLRGHTHYTSSTTRRINPRAE